MDRIRQAMVDIEMTRCDSWVALVSLAGLTACEANPDRRQDAGCPPPNFCRVTEDESSFACAGLPVAVCSEPSRHCSPPEFDQCDMGWCRVRAGTFFVGRHHAVLNWAEFPRRPITLTRDFVVMDSEVSVRQWLDLVGGEDPSPFSCGGDCPVVGITFSDALHYANELSVSQGLEPCYSMSFCTGGELGHGLECSEIQFAGPDCSGFRLPSEFEWELVAGDGTGECIPDVALEPLQQSHFDCKSWTNPPTDLAWFCGNASVDYAGCLDLSMRVGSNCAGLRPVRAGAPNRRGIWGLYGNAAEFTGSRYEWPMRLPAPPFPVWHEVDPGFESFIVSENVGLGVVVRGGSFASYFLGVCSYSRNLGSVQGASPPTTGFRLVRTTSATVP